MADRIRRTKRWRKVHLVTSMFVIVFTAFFLLSGFMMIRYDLFPAGEPVRYVKTLPMTVPVSDHPEHLGKQIKHAYDLRGRMDKPIQLKDGRWHFFFARPGVTQMAIISLDHDSIQITRTEQLTVPRVVNRIHHLRGYTGGWKYLIWGVLYDMSALSLLVFALTGILMWFPMRKGYPYGWWFVGTGFGITILVILAMYFLA
ncbi:MAG TPA: PepSY-associated TM helix domain-containing protein [Bacteroidales bacterium]|nr:PepSY-associated TM helix domain-containing protein [Bacteroidales bacterium]